MKVLELHTRNTKIITIAESHAGITKTMKILEFHVRIMNIMKINEFLMIITKIKKIIELHKRLMKIMKIIEFDANKIEIITNPKIPVEHCENY